MNDTISTSDFSSKHSYYGTRSIYLLANVTAFPRHLTYTDRLSGHNSYAR